MSRVTPISQITRRAPEAGRIRLGVKDSAKGFPKAIDKLRFTSPNRAVIEEIAARYGGTAAPWNDPSANPSNQWQVIATTDEIPVYLVPDGVDSSYELWDKGGCQRRCDGETCEIPIGAPDGYELERVPCICDRAGAMECKAVTRLNVILPEIRFTGTWRLESKGWNAQAELPGMFDFITSMAERGLLVEALLGVEKREKMHRGRKKNFVVPRLSVKQTPQEMLAGPSNIALEVPSSMPALETPAHDDDHADVIDVEVVDDDLLALEAELRKAGEYFGLDAERFVAAAKLQVKADRTVTPEQRTRLREALAKMAAGTLAPVSFRPDGLIEWRQ